MYETTDPLEYAFLTRRHIPVVRTVNGVYYFQKTHTLFLELFNYYYQLEQRLEYDALARACDDLPIA